MTKPKRRRLPPPPKARFQPFTPDQTVDGSISPSSERLIGVISVAWAKLEVTMHDLIWTLVGLSMEDGRILTEKQDAVRLINMLYVLGERHLPDYPTTGKTPYLEQFMQILDKIDHFRRDRNFIMHGSWGNLNGVPGAFSIREKSERADEFIFETFPDDRLKELAEGIIGCAKFMNLSVRIVEASRETSESRPRATEERD